MRRTSELSASEPSLSPTACPSRWRNAWGEGIEREFEDRTVWAMQLREELDGVRSELAEQESEVEKRTHWALGLQAELDRSTADRQRIESSRWFRLSQKLGLFQK